MLTDHNATLAMSQKSIFSLSLLVVMQKLDKNPEDKKAGKGQGHKLVETYLFLFLYFVTQVTII